MQERKGVRPRRKGSVEVDYLRTGGGREKNNKRGDVSTCEVIDRTTPKNQEGKTHWNGDGEGIR